MFKLVLTVTLMAFPAFGAQTKVRLGWQVPWATQGQLVQILKHTDILAKNGLEMEFIGRTFGPQLNELALAGAVDVILTADQPAAILFAQNKGWAGIGRLMYNRTATYVPLNSKLRNVADLKGKTIGVPMGAAAERVLNEALQKAGLNPKSDVTITNLDILEQGPLVKSNLQASRWGNFDALAGFDPTAAIFEAKQLARILDVGKVVSMIVASEAFLKTEPSVAPKILAAFTDAYEFYRTNEARANKWFLEEAKLDGADDKACVLAASLEPNLKAENKAKISLRFSDEDFKYLQRAADFVEAKTKKKVNMSEFVSNRYVK